MPKYFLNENQREQKLQILKERYKNIQKNDECLDDTIEFKSLDEMKKYYQQFRIKYINKPITLQFFNKQETICLKMLYGC